MSSNRFDERAATWDDDPAKVERSRTVAERIRAEVALEPGMRLLEYGAGTGLVTQALRDQVGPVTLADSSHGMLEVLQEKVASGAIPDARVWDLDLARDPVPDERFDLLVTAMTLHHIPDLAPVLHGLATVLDEGGHLCVVDLEREDGSFHDDADFEGHDGFDRDELATRLAGVGLTRIRFGHAGEVDRHERTYGLFLAVCTKVGTTRGRELSRGRRRRR